MIRRVLGRTGVEVSELGFGCVQLTAQDSRRSALKTLEAAFDAGITHFDTARIYGFGRSEGILGEFLRGKRDRVTVATKFGLSPPSGLAGNKWIIAAAKKLLKPFPAFRRRVQKGGAALTTSGLFTPDAAIASLKTSLEELGTDYVDLFLLHEAALADALQGALLDALQREIDKGTVRSIGVASNFGIIGEAAGALPEAYGVLQFNDHAVDQNMSGFRADPRVGLITYSIFRAAPSLGNAALRCSDTVQRFSSLMNADLRDPGVIGALLLHYALQSNSSGCVLFSSTNPKRIAANAREAERPRFSESQLAHFLEFCNEVRTDERNLQ